MKQKLVHIDSFDYLRCIGMVLVLVQHQLSVMNLKAFTSFAGISLGQIGVSIFLVLSGFLALRSNRPPKEWLIARLSRIYPAYWIATVGSFLAAIISGYKPFTLFQFFSQMAGLGLLTHRGQLINVATWFVSLLLGLYFVLFLARLTAKTNFIVTLLAGCSLVFTMLRIEPLISAHSASFFLAAAIFEKDEHVQSFRFILPLLFVLTIPFKEFIYPAIAISLLILTKPLSAPPIIVSFLSKYSYEFYLVHGIFIVGSYELIGQTPWAYIPIGITLSILAAIVLKQLTLYLGVWAKNNIRSFGT